MSADPTSAERVYKILRAGERAALEANGAFEGSADDRRDGFIHLSRVGQMRGTLDKYFRGESVIIAVVDAASLSDLRYEVSRGGALFPHLYGVLEMSSVLELVDAPWANDKHKLPDWAAE